MNRIDEEAAGWAVRLGTRNLSADERSELDAWLAADSRHQGALVRARTAWVGLDRLGALAAGRQSQPRRTQGVNRRWMIAAGVSTFVVAGAGSWLALRPSGVSFESGIGELRSVPLPDGSNMLLNTSSEAVVSFGKARREVRLRRGEALFEVAKDPARPFVVRTDEVLVSAVGTAFAVRIDDARVDVTVTEGVVEVSRQPGVVSEPVRRVSANERAVAVPSRSVKVEPIRRQDAERRLAWRNGMVAFDGESLREAISEVNRHSRRRIVVDDAALAARPIAGLFRATDTETFAQTAAAALGAEAVADGDVIRLQPVKTP